MQTDTALTQGQGAKDICLQRDLLRPTRRSYARLKNRLTNRRKLIKNIQNKRPNRRIKQKNLKRSNPTKRENKVEFNLLIKTRKLILSCTSQLLLATHPYCIRMRQGQHYRRDVACLGQEFNFTPERGRFKSIGDSHVAVLDNIAYTKVKLFTQNKKI